MVQEVRTDPRVAVIAPAGKVTYEEFLAWLDEDTWAEWVDGEAVLKALRAEIAGLQKR